MRNGFLRGSAGQLATASVVIVAVISAAIWCTIWRYESASNSSLVALNAISVSRDTYALEIHFQDEKDAATKYVLVPSPAFRQANVAAGNAFAAQLADIRADTQGTYSTVLDRVAAGEQHFNAVFTSLSAAPRTTASAQVHAVAQLEAFRRGAGPDVGLHLDTNFNYKIDGYIRLARALEALDLVWLEIDLYDPAGLNLIRRSARTPVASLESIYGRRNFRPYFENQSVDYAIIDVAWNGILESLKIAAMADAYEVNVAPHNYYGHLCSAVSAHFCAVVPNFRVMEIDIDSVAWRDELFINAPVVENGDLIVPDRPGWGVDVNEAAVRAHPPKGR